MSGLFEQIFSFIQDKTRSVSKRAAVIVLFLITLICFDCILDVTYNISVNYKLEQLSQINKLKLEYSEIPAALATIEELENKILDRRHYSDHLSALGQSLSDLLNKEASPSIAATDDHSVNTNSNTSNNSENPISLVYMVLSSNLVTVLITALLMLMLIVTPFFEKDSKLQVMLGFGLLIVLCVGVIAVVTRIAYSIPLLSPDNPAWNYALNIVIHLIVVGLIVYGIKVSTKKKKGAKKSISN